MVCFFGSVITFSYIHLSQSSSYFPVKVNIENLEHEDVKLRATLINGVTNIYELASFQHEKSVRAVDSWVTRVLPNHFVNVGEAGVF